MTDLMDAAAAVDEDAVAEQAASGFAVRLDNFEGPFDLLLSLIAKHKLDITEVALSRVTDEFIVHVKALGAAWDLEQTTSFLVVASTLLDLKAARLLPQGDVEDEEDLALLEARDLLFARLLQYKAFKQVAGVLERRLAGEARRHPRAVGLEERYAGLLPEVLIGIGLDQFAVLAARALEPKHEPELSLGHIHAPTVSVREQAVLVADRLRRSGTMTFRALVGDSPDTLTTVARFLSLLELFREGAVAFDQVAALGELSVRWTGGEAEDFEIDEFEGAPPEAAETDHAERAEPEQELSLLHLHAPRVSVREQAALVVERLRRTGTMTFRALCGDSPDTLTTVARFLSLLELFREGAVAFEQAAALSELTIRWTGTDDASADELVTDEFDGAPQEAATPEPGAAAEELVTDEFDGAPPEGPADEETT